MIKVDGYKAYRGKMRITPRTTFYSPFTLEGEFLYKPENACWYHEDESYAEEVCLPLEEYCEVVESSINPKPKKYSDLCEAAFPLQDFLYKYYHPHAMIIVTQDSAEVLVGDCAVPLPIRD